MLARRIYEAIADAWVVYLGEDVAHERARNAATALLSHDLDPDRTITTLTRCFAAARERHNGGVELQDEEISEAVARAIVALANADEGVAA